MREDAIGWRVEECRAADPAEIVYDKYGSPVCIAGRNAYAQCLRRETDSSVVVCGYAETVYVAWFYGDLCPVSSVCLVCLPEDFAGVECPVINAGVQDVPF